MAKLTLNEANFDDAVQRDKDKVVKYKEQGAYEDPEYIDPDEPIDEDDLSPEFKLEAD